MPYFAKIFEEQPREWGLRGDPYLWFDIESTLKGAAPPKTLQEFKLLIETKFKELTGFSVTRKEFIFLEKYSLGDMADGCVCPEFWRMKAIPLLSMRYAGILKTLQQAQHHDCGRGNEPISPKKRYTLLGADGKSHASEFPGSIGGYQPLRIYGRLDCRSARAQLSKGRYANHRVFFADEAAAIAAGYRPCGICLRERYRTWKLGGETGSKEYPWLLTPPK